MLAGQPRSAVIADGPFVSLYGRTESVGYPGDLVSPAAEQFAQDKR
jgi:hypothetical protein